MCVLFLFENKNAFHFSPLTLPSGSVMFIIVIYRRDHRYFLLASLARRRKGPRYLSFLKNLPITGRTLLTSGWSERMTLL